MHRLSFVLASLAISACGIVLGTGDELDAPPRPDPSGTDANGIDVASATGESDGAPSADAGDASADAIADGDAARAVKHVFVTRAVFTGAFGSRAAADAACTSAASAAGRGNGTWKAFLADVDGADPADRIADREWVLYDGTRVFAKGPKTDVSPSTVIALDEAGLGFGTTPNKHVWTGLATATPANDRTCAGWTSNAGSAFGGYGDMFVAGGIQWKQQGPTAGCDVTHRLYCFED